jgi:hypothetical protein
MNERIKLLAEQATIKTSYQYQTWGDRIATVHKEQFDKEKFAELILLEVTDILMSYRGKVVFEDGAEYNYEHPIIAIRKHFGVKE